MAAGESAFCGVQQQAAIQFLSRLCQLGENLLVAGELAVAVNLPADVPQERIEPVEAEQELVNPLVHQIVSRCMNQFMVEGELKLGLHPLVSSGLRQEDYWMKQANCHRTGYGGAFI